MGVSLKIMLRDLLLISLNMLWFGLYLVYGSSCVNDGGWEVMCWCCVIVSGLVVLVLGVGLGVGLEGLLVFCVVGVFIVGFGVLLVGIRWGFGNSFLRKFMCLFGS